MPKTVVQVAVSAAVYAIDKAYDYELPEEFCEKVFEGSRVVVPFGNGNRTAFGFVLKICREIDTEGRRLKKVIHVYNEYGLTKDNITLANWMRSRYFCTFFEAASCMLPPKIWGKMKDGRLTGIVDDKTIRHISLNCSYDEALEKIGKGKMAEKRLAVLNCFLDFESLPEQELIYLTGVSKGIIKTLCEKNVLKSTSEEIFRRPVFRETEPKKVCLSDEQMSVLEKLRGLKEDLPAAALLFGVTGSGKTEVYIKLIEDALKEGRGAMMLVPEIALTPQIVSRFCQYFKNDLAILHSMLTDAQRYDEYKRIKSGKARVVIGTRSAVFAPIADLGVIIIDEEHEYSYKSESAPKYSAIDIAKYRVACDGGLLVLGSATPSVETFYNAVSGRYELCELTSRFGDTPLPQVQIADLRVKKQGESEIGISAELKKELELNAELKEQSILFVNRRGNSGKVACTQCGYVPQCEHCSVALTYHSKNNRLMCHYCAHSVEMFDRCPVCGSQNIKEIGFGTQKAEIMVKELFPKANVVRMDADTTVRRISHEKLLEEFEQKGDILIGTQMVAKGLDFDNVTLVGVLDSDIALYSGDFRASARTFSLISQVVGRAGRRKKQGRAVIQTYSPEHPVILSAARQDYRAFYDYEIKIRKMLGLPPFSDIFLFTLTGKDEVKTLKAALRVSATLSKAFDGEYRDIKSNILGPVAPSIYKIQDRYKYNISFRGKDDRRTREFISKILLGFARQKENGGVTLSAEINPLNY